MCDAEAQAEFMERNCFYCERLKATITHRQCELNRQKPRISEARPEKSAFGFTTNKPVDYMPFACYGCSDFEPWLDGPHEAALDYMLAKRADLIRTTDKRIASVNDRAILGCAQAILRCRELKERADA